MKKGKIGFRYILIVVCAFGLMGASNGISNCTGIFYQSLADNIGGGIGTISLCSTIKGIFVTLLSAVMPWVLEKFRFRYIIAAGAICSGIGFGGSIFARSFLSLLLCYFVQGIGYTLLGAAIINFMIGNWFYERTGTMLGIAMTASGVVGAVMNPVFSAIMTASGWKTSMAVLAVCSAALALPALFFASGTPHEMGLLPYGADEEKVYGTAENEKKEEKSTAKVKMSFELIAMLIVSGFISAATVMNSHLSTMAVSLGMTITQGALLVSIGQVGNVVFKIFIGYLSDRINAVRTLIITGILVCFGMSAYLLRVDSFPVLAAATFLFGASFGSCTVGLAQIVRDVIEPKEYSSAYAYCLISSSFVYSLAEIFTGYLYDWTGAYVVSSLVLIAMEVVSILLMVIVQLRKNTKKQA